ncbi:hypothetical protein OH77DRAFT_1421360 [Trametes cingulata]|nr:hypothetical protein OH77DRAFT_1421360 [Trametes cingulata]
MVRNTTTKDRVFVALRRNGSGSFSHKDMVERVRVQHLAAKMTPPKRLPHLVDNPLNLLARKHLLKRRRSQPDRYRIEEELKKILRASRTDLPANAHPKVVGDYFKVRIGELKDVPKRVLWEEFLKMQEEKDALSDQVDRLSRDNADARAGHGRPVSQAGTSQEPIDVDASMEVDKDENPFLTLTDNQDAGARPSRPTPQTPQRVQPSQSYPTPPTTISPPSRGVSNASVAPASPIEDRFTHSTLEPIHEEPVTASVTGQPAPIPSRPVNQDDASGPAQHADGSSAEDSLNRLLELAQTAKRQAHRERLQMQRQLDEAKAAVAAGAERDARRLQQIADLQDEIDVHSRLCAQAEEAVAAREQELAEARRRNQGLAGERDFYRKKHVVTAAALRSSQRDRERLEGQVVRLEVEAERREQAGTDLVARMRAAMGQSPWGSRLVA